MTPETSDMAPRRFILVDIENLTGGQATRGEAKALWHLLARETLRITDRDHVVIGGNRYVAKKFSDVIVGGNIRWVVGAEGPDAADRALLAACNLHQVAKAYGELIIMSGDHAFTELAHRARVLGLRTHVVATTRTSGQPSLSRDLAASAHVTTTIPDPRVATRGGATSATPAAA